MRMVRLAPEIRAVNDLFFGPLDAATFDVLASTAGALVRSSWKAVHHLDALAQDGNEPLLAQDAVG